jgi:regulation of enolase protein 1 (concanavalin A-like superfamily)
VQKIDIAKAQFLTFCTTTAKPSKFNFNAPQNHFEITAAGTDFLHAEDSYGAIYLKQAIEGNFVATVKVVGFSEGISEWFRAGIFVRNDLTKGDGKKPATLGSFLLFSTTKRCGAQWDEFGDGCMHNTKSKNYGVDNPIPAWIKLVRHGNSFTGYFSLDGKTWIVSRESGDIPGMAAKMDIGLAGGANDQKVSTVTFEDFQLSVEKK